MSERSVGRSIRRPHVHTYIHVCSSMYREAWVLLRKKIRRGQSLNNPSPPQRNVVQVRSGSNKRYTRAVQSRFEPDRRLQKHVAIACLRPGLNRGPSVYKTDALPLSHAGATRSATTTIFQHTKIGEPRHSQLRDKTHPRQQDHVRHLIHLFTSIIDRAMKTRTRPGFASCC